MGDMRWPKGGRRRAKRQARRAEAGNLEALLVRGYQRAVDEHAPDLYRATMRAAGAHWLAGDDRKARRLVETLLRVDALEEAKHAVLGAAEDAASRLGEQAGAGQAELRRWVAAAAESPGS